MLVNIPTDRGGNTDVTLQKDTGNAKTELGKKRDNARCNLRMGDIRIKKVHQYPNVTNV